jgi:prepilin-type N-terminal cleavage/methylation domain-containing protein
MKRRDWLSPNAPGARGFSLIEILVVMGIIAFLTAAIVVIIPRVANASKVAATKATIKKVDELLNDRINGFNRWIQKQNTIAGSNVPNYVIAAGYGTQYTQNPQLYQFLSAKIAFRASFPQNFQEAGTSLSPPIPSAHNAVTESAACLYMILTQAALFDTEPPAAAELRGLEVADTDGDGLMEIVDSWGQPLRYYRWPTRLFRPATSSGTMGTAGWNNLSPAPAPTPASILASTAPRGPILQWTHNTNYAAGQNIQPATVPAGDVMMYQCNVNGGGPTGTSGPTEPNWSSALAATSSPSSGADGNITWVAVLDPLTIDSDDPNGLASSTLVNESTFHTWTTYHVPLIVSAGTDGVLGLYEPWQTFANAGVPGNLAQPEFDSTDTSGFARNAMYDDITNHQ